MNATTEYMKNASLKELYELSTAGGATGQSAAALAELRHRDIRHQESIAKKHVDAARTTGIASIVIAIATVGLWLLQLAKTLGWLS